MGVLVVPHLCNFCNTYYQALCLVFLWMTTLIVVSICIFLMINDRVLFHACLLVIFFSSYASHIYLQHHYGLNWHLIQNHLTLCSQVWVCIPYLFGIFYFVPLICLSFYWYRGLSYRMYNGLIPLIHYVFKIILIILDHLRFCINFRNLLICFQRKPSGILINISFYL